MSHCISLKGEQLSQSSFPPGCKVYIYSDSSNTDDKNSLPCILSEGTVVDVKLQMKPLEMLFEVRTSPSESHLIVEGRLRFRNDCPVYVNIIEDASSMVPKPVHGVVLGSCDTPTNGDRGLKSSYWYSVAIRDEILHEVSPSCVNFRSTCSQSTERLVRSVEEQGKNVSLEQTDSTPDNQDEFSAPIPSAEDSDCLKSSRDNMQGGKGQNSTGCIDHCSKVLESSVSIQESSRESIMQESMQIISPLHPPCIRRVQVEKSLVSLEPGMEAATPTTYKRKRVEEEDHTSKHRFSAFQKQDLRNHSNLHERNVHYREDLFQHFRSCGISLSDLRNVSREKIPPSFWDDQKQMCLAYHICGNCMKTCKCATDHRRLPESHAVMLYEWCKRNYSCVPGNNANPKAVHGSYTDNLSAKSTILALKKHNKEHKPVKTVAAYNSSYRGDLFAKFLVQGLKKHLKEEIPSSPWDARGPMCLAYHVGGNCMSNCRRSVDHRSLSSENVLRLFRWCERNNTGKICHLQHNNHSATAGQIYSARRNSTFSAVCRITFFCLELDKIFRKLSCGVFQMHLFYHLNKRSLTKLHDVRIPAILIGIGGGNRRTLLRKTECTIELFKRGNGSVANVIGKTHEIAKWGICTIMEMLRKGLGIALEESDYMVEECSPTGM